MWYCFVLKSQLHSLSLSGKELERLYTTDISSLLMLCGPAGRQLTLLALGFDKHCKGRRKNDFLSSFRYQKQDWQWEVSVSSVYSLSRVWLFATPWTAARQDSLSITNSWSWLKLMSIESVMPSNHLLLCHPLLLLPSIFPSIRVFSNESVLHIRWPKDWSFSISRSNEYSGLISFRMDWLDLLAVQGTLKSLLQHHSSILLRSAFFIVQLSHPYMTTGKTIALTRQTFVEKYSNYNNLE